MVDFKNTILIMTSNIGSEYLLEGITPEGEIDGTTRDLVMNQLRAHFRPEFLNRLDEIILFKPLTKADIGHIVDLEISKLNRRLADRKISIELDGAAKDFVIANGYDPAYGARPLKRYLQKHIETMAAKIILAGEISEDSVLCFGVRDNELEVTVRQDKKPAD